MSKPTPSTSLDLSDPLTLDDEALGRLLAVETEKRTGWAPHAWQVRLAVAVLQRRDVLCIAGTGFGKTVTFVMPLFVRKKMIVWIISPLNYIEEEQVRAFEEWGVKAVAVNWNTDFESVKEVCRVCE
ncbi:hypothetical protein FS749_006462 [Ceratobasidium sp. UAMH 11750]|nr:hypothetical protein FS749_006462 [Ceratobasidium sp. UAMH 11750]